MNTTTTVRKRKPKTKCKKLFAFYPWVGGKHYLKNWLKTRVPSKFEIYYEPFLGAGSLWLELKPTRCVVNDVNPYLPLMFWCVKYQYTLFLRNLNEIVTLYDSRGKQGFVDALTFFNNKSVDIPSNYDISVDKLDDIVTKAAIFLYLLKRSHNGNVSLQKDGKITCTYWNNRQRITLYNPALVKAIHDYLVTANVIFMHGDYREALKTCTKNDFVYLDPPYMGGKMKTTMWAYSTVPFDHGHFIRNVHSLNEHGTKFAMTNKNDTDLVKCFEEDCYNIQRLTNVRGFSQSEHGIVYRNDVLITNYSLDDKDDKEIHF